MSQINVNRIKDSNEGAPDFPSGVNVGGITSTVTLGVTNLNPTNLNVSGVVTATTLDGSLLATGTPTLGLGVTINASGLNISGVATAGIVSATTLYGNGANLTGIALTIAPLNYNPAVFSQASHLTKASGIGLTFNQGVKAGSGNVTLSLANAGVAGTVVENFGVGNSVTYGDSDYGTTITITPTADLTVNQDYHLSYPSGAFTTIGGDVSFVGTAYTFKGRDYSYQLWLWGYGNQGQLAQNNRTSYSSPVQVPGSWGTSIVLGGSEGSAIGTKGDGTLWSWGYGNFGEIGNNTSGSGADYSSPVQVPGTTWNIVGLGRYEAAAIKTDGTLWAWGNNSQGALGQNNITQYSSPVQVGSDTTWSGIFMNHKNAYGVKTDGTLFTWGNNEIGQLGQNNVDVFYSSPVQLPGTTWSSGKYKWGGGYRYTSTVKTDGTLWAWGNNEYGQLGQNNKTQRSSPVQVPGTTWKYVSDGVHQDSVAAIKTDGTLWSWGQNGEGCLGHSESPSSNKSSPTQVPGTTWDRVAFGHTLIIATKTDGTLWSWGQENFGALGHGDVVKRSSPIQIPGTWSHPLASPYNSFSGALKQI